MQRQSREVVGTAAAWAAAYYSLCELPASGPDPSAEGVVEREVNKRRQN